MTHVPTPAQFTAHSMPIVTPVTPDIPAIAKAVETVDPGATVTALAGNAYDAANSYAHLVKEKSDLENEHTRLEIERDHATRCRNEYGRYGVRITAPYDAATRQEILISSGVALAIFLIDSLGIWYVMATYVANSAFFDNLAGDVVASLPYAAVVLFGAPSVYWFGILRRNDIQQKRFADIVFMVGLIALIGFCVALAVMGSNGLPARGAYNWVVAFGLILCHGAVSVAFGAYSGLARFLRRQNAGTQLVVKGEGYAYGETLVRALCGEMATIDARLAEIARLLAVIAAGRVQCVESWLAELAHVQADLAAVAAQARANRRMTIAAGSPPAPVPAAFSTPSMPSDVTPATVN